MASSDSFRCHHYDITTKCNIVNHLEHPRVGVHELLVSTCPKQVQHEHMSEETESGVHPELRRCMAFLIHFDAITTAKFSIVNHLKHSQGVIHEPSVSTCPKQVQNEHMGEETESGVNPEVSKCMASSDSFRCHHYD